MTKKEELKFKYLEVTPRNNESIERTIKRFSKKVRNDGILSEVIDRRFFVKASKIRRDKKAKSRYIRKLNK